MVGIKLKSNNFLGVGGEDFFANAGFGRRFTHEGGLLGAGAFFSFTKNTKTIGAKAEFVLMTIKNSTLFFVAGKSIVTGSG